MADEIGQKIKRTREAKGLSQRDLAKLVGVSQQTVAYWEQGGTPRLPKQRRIAEALEWNKPEAERWVEPSVLDNLEKRRTWVKVPASETRPLLTRPEVKPDPIAEDEIATVRQRMKEIYAEHESATAQYREDLHARLGGVPKSLIMALDPERMSELRGLRQHLFERTLISLRAVGAPGTITMGDITRRYDYVSPFVVAELVEIMYPDERRIMSGLRHANEIVKLAVAKAQRSDVTALLIVVVEIGELEEIRALMKRTEFDAISLGVSIRFVKDQIQAAEVIVATERAAPLMATMNATEEDDTVEARATIPEATALGIAGHPPDVKVHPPVRTEDSSP